MPGCSGRGTRSRCRALRTCQSCCSQRSQGSGATRRGVVVGARRTSSLAALRHLVCRGTGRLLLNTMPGAVARHGAVAFLVGGNNAGVYGFVSPGVDGAGGCPLSKVRSWVMPSSSLVTRRPGGYLRDLHLGGGEAVVAGRLHLHGGGLTGRATEPAEENDGRFNADGFTAKPSRNAMATANAAWKLCLACGTGSGSAPPG